ncbi:hypothetical protein N6H18_17625 [Reichenbachiella agarivorans]|uniref:Uncharacterized protein n=1 Tax=Reichenbachiella agarivorans TaxID=2979464 RepID=A0ABY6CNQ8_9BACT|nr:hypothetical protein [Reichenbachiella agarivorans]UXP32162.1 hypothetical protein N6H18_17625 [Reichenbachiella agarivorans]
MRRFVLTLSCIALTSIATSESQEPQIEQHDDAIRESIQVNRHAWY